MVTRLCFDDQILIRIRYDRDIAGRTHLGNETIVAGGAYYEIYDFRANAQHVQQIEAADQRIGIDPPEQPVGVAVVGYREVHEVGDGRRMHAGQRLLHQAARRQNEGIFALFEFALEPWLRVLRNDLKIAGLHRAGTGQHQLDDRSKRAVGNDVIRYEKEEAGVEHRLAGAPHRTGEGQGNGRGVIALGDDVINQVKADRANPREPAIARALADHRLVPPPRKKDELGGQGLGQRRQVARGEQRRQAYIEKLLGKLVAPNWQQYLDPFRGRPRFQHGLRLGLGQLCGDGAVVWHELSTGLPHAVSLHPSDVIVAIVGHRVRDLAAVEGPLEVANGIFNAVSRQETQLAANLLRRHVVGAVIVGRSDDDVHAVADFRAYHIGDLANTEVVVTRVPNFAVDNVIGCIEQHQVEVGHVLDVKVGAQLFASEHGDALGVDCEVGENIDRQVKAQTGRIAAHCRRTQRHGDKAGLAFFGEDVFAQRLVPRIVGQRRERQILGHLGLALDAIHRRGGGIDETAHSRCLRGAHQRPKAIVIDRPAERRIEVKRRVVGDTGKVDDRVAAGEPARHV